MVQVKGLTELTVGDLRSEVKDEDEWWVEIKELSVRGVKRLLESAMEAELLEELHVGKYRRTELRRGYRNDPLTKKPGTVLGEHSGVEAALHDLQVQESAEQKVVVRLFAGGSLAAPRTQGDEEGILQQPLGRDLWSSHVGAHPIELEREPPQVLSPPYLEDRRRSACFYPPSSGLLRYEKLLR